MKVIIDARLDRAGVGRYTRGLVNALAPLDSGVDYVLLLRSQTFANFSPPAPNVRAMRADFDWYSMDEQLRLPRLLRRERPDVVHFPHFNVPLMAPRPYVVTIHDLTHMTHDFARPGALGTIRFRAKRIPYRVVVRAAASRASMVLTVSNYSRSVIERELHIPGHKVSVTYEAGAELTLRSPSASAPVSKCPFFLYVGNAYPYKNLGRLIRAFGTFVQSSDAPYELVLAGDHREFVRDLESQAARAGVAERVRMLGPVDDDVLDGLYRAATALAFVSTSEGFGLPGLEAMRRGTPVIAACGSALPEIYGDAALYVDPFSEAAIADALLRIVGDSILRERLVEKGLFRESQFTWTQAAERTLAAYRAAATGAAPQSLRYASDQAQGSSWAR